MKYRPILFSARMIGELLAGRKTQTRRLVRRLDKKDWIKVRLPLPVRGDSSPWARLPESRRLYAPAGVYQAIVYHHGAVAVATRGGAMLGVRPHEFELLSPYGVPGDRLWVRECFRAWCTVGAGNEYRVEYRADGRHRDLSTYGDISADDVERTWRIVADATGKWRPGIHMPRWASRIELGITRVRLERLQDISCADIRAEGLRCPEHDEDGALPFDEESRIVVQAIGPCSGECPALRQAWATGWDALPRSQPRGRWANNPWVWAVDFERLPAEVRL